MACDRWCHFGDLWNTVAYCRLSTIWVPQVLGDFTKPRGCYEDCDEERPAGYGLRQDHHADHLIDVRAQFIGRCVCDAAGNWVEDDRFGLWAAFDQRSADCFPEQVRPH